ncbi:uncharacterized protein A4U43_C02F12530 [Asparagus officinalis]|uniref:Protein kinase domain-containing protein n=1 Tax=Asparagus officinalis TaxID=4686 RepID=A0A5P1FMU0_ASPOF|nr:uncharacterized protein A4U43_C02F12530 [Asparagus officinalis]
MWIIHWLLFSVEAEAFQKSAELSISSEFPHSSPKISKFGDLVSSSVLSFSSKNCPNFRFPTVSNDQALHIATAVGSTLESASYDTGRVISKDDSTPLVIVIPGLTSDSASPVTADLTPLNPTQVVVKFDTFKILGLIFRGLAYIHNFPGVCHRDVKPQNVLVDPLTHQVKIFDFESDKILACCKLIIITVKGEANISYIYSWYYRATELIFDATESSTSIDIWSAGCVLAELLLGQVLGTPTREEIRCMKTNYTDLAIQRLNLIHGIRSFSTRKGAQSKAYIDSARPSHCKGLV